MLHDYYKILGVSNYATEGEIKKAFRHKAKIYHPDVNNSARAHESFSLVNEAYSVLIDSDQRKKYDLKRAYGAYFRPTTPNQNTHHTQTSGHTHTSTRRTHHNHAHFHYNAKGFYHSKANFSKSNPYQFNGIKFSPLIYNLFFASGMFVGFLLIFITFASIFVGAWPFLFILFAIPGVIMVREGWKGIVRHKAKSKK